jgi:hypothetical protein
MRRTSSLELRASNPFRTTVSAWVALAVLAVAPGCYTQVKSSGWPAPGYDSEPRKAPPRVAETPSDEDDLQGEFIGTIHFEFDPGTGNERTFSGRPSRSSSRTACIAARAR